MAGLRMTGRTDTGMVREHNEDCFLVLPEQGLAVLADGMGGHLAGEVASAMAIDRVTTFMMSAFRQAGATPPAPVEGLAFETYALSDAVQSANASIHQGSYGNSDQSGMGTTVVAAAFHGQTVSVAHVGDSRMYRLRGADLNQLTADHSMVQELLRRGLMTPEEARTSPNKNFVTRALGIEAKAEVDVAEHPVEPGDTYLICSDGLTDVLLDEEIRDILLAFGGDLDKASEALVAEANARGGPDNVSVILIRAEGPFHRSPPTGVA